MATKKTEKQLHEEAKTKGLRGANYNAYVFGHPTRGPMADQRSGNPKNRPRKNGI